MEKEPQPTEQVLSGSDSDLNHTHSSPEIDLEKDGQLEGYTLNADAVDGSKNYRLAKDGHTILIPQPSDDPKDPLNWSWGRKHLIVFIISFCAFIPDYAGATGGVVLLTQSK